MPYAARKVAGSVLQTTINSPTCMDTPVGNWNAIPSIRQVLLGFAADTSEVEENAVDKHGRKNLDMIVANDVSKPGVGFEHDTNEVVVLMADGSRHHVPLSDKREIARAVLDAALGVLHRPPETQEQE